MVSFRVKREIFNPSKLQQISTYGRNDILKYLFPILINPHPAKAGTSIKKGAYISFYFLLITSD